MKIEVLGSGCSACKKFFELTKRAVEEIGIEAEVEYIDDIQRIIEMGIMQPPVLVIDGNIVMTGEADIEKIKQLITSGNKSAS